MVAYPTLYNTNIMHIEFTEKKKSRQEIPTAVVGRRKGLKTFDSPAITCARALCTVAITVLK